GRIAGQLLQRDAGRFARLVGAVRVDERLLQLGTLRGVPGDDLAPLLVLGDLALLGHVLALLAEFDVLAHHRVVLLEHETVRVVATVLARHVGVPGAGGPTKLDDGADVLLLGHQIFSPRARRSLTTDSMPRASITLMPLALSVSVTLRRSEGT